eukprot:TRINITY_DN92153_c0_g1_i1.p1 TRINITY_DN92153_c0_g1~~TRINITY_DN92153_c0_g1_i1.p1  ORF type:complete len:306 (-),score=44.99 TRINITY_DN92153_c0_g1_i1:146-1063(-)
MAATVTALVEDIVPIDCTTDEKEFIDLEVQVMSGESKLLNISSTASLHQARMAVEGLIGMPADCQKWMKGTTTVIRKHDSTLAEAGLGHGDVLTVVHTGFNLVSLPDHFELELRSIREKLRPSYSSAFAILYAISVDVPRGFMRIEPWRKNDHDIHEYDQKAATASHTTSHWMAGSSTRTCDLKGKDPLQEFLSGWNKTGGVVTDDSERFWLQECPVAEAPIPPNLSVFQEEQESPYHAGLPGSFIAPSQDCLEIRVDLPLLRKRIVRMLTDMEGNPIRAAVKGCQQGSLHMDIEEYVLKIKTSA